MKLLIGGPAGTWLNSEVAEANLAKDLVERMGAAFLEKGVAGIVSVVPSTPVAVVASALSLFAYHEAPAGVVAEFDWQYLAIRFRR